MKSKSPGSKEYFPLLLIVILAFFLRIWRLGEVPPGPNWDEAALGYNAYSVLHTGRDEYGTYFPLSLRSYDDYKPPLYMYLTVPSVALFDLNIWSVRLPAVMSGVLAVLGSFFLAKALFAHSERVKNKLYLPYLVSFLLAISPWHIQFSRMAFEASIGVTINIWAVTLFLWGLNRTKFLSISAFLFGLSLYAYHSQRIFAPLLLLVFGLCFYKKLLSKKKEVVTAIIVGLLTIAPLIPVFTNPETLTRLRGTSSLADQTGLLRRSVEKLERDKALGSPLGLLFDNRRVVYVQTLIEGYLSHFSLRWIFISGDNARHHAPGMGLLYVVELPFLLLGLLALGSIGGIVAFSIFGWFIIAPIAASPTTELPHAIRTLVFLPTFQIAVALGLSCAWEWLRKQITLIRNILLCCFIVLALFNFFYYLTMYFVHQNAEYSKFWQYGYTDAVNYAKDAEDEYEKIVVSIKLEQPHMFFLFHLKYNPKTYLAEGGTASGGFAEIRNRFGKYEFRSIKWDEEIHDGSILYIGTPGEIRGTPLRTIYYLNGEEAMKIAT